MSVSSSENRHIRKHGVGATTEPRSVFGVPLLEWLLEWLFGELITGMLQAYRTRIAGEE